jgi:neutral ceramidase
MKVGAASVDITPPLGQVMEGYEVRASGAIGIHDRLHARALVAEGADGTIVALMVADLIQVDPHLQELVAAEVLERTGIPRERLQLAGTHTHSGPMLREPSEVETTIGHGIAEAIVRAWTDRRDAVAAVGIGEVTGIGANRRPNGGPVDDRVTVTRFDGVDGRPIATHVNYGCHPTTLGPNNLLYSADYPGALCRLMDEAVGGVTLFSTGPQGDVNPGGYSPEGSMVGVVVPWRTFESAERYGRILADRAIEVRAGLRPMPADRVWGDARVVELRRKRLPDPLVARRAATVAREAAGIVTAADLTPDATYHALVAAAYAELLAEQAEDPERDAPVRIRASALALGPLLHIGISGELFVALGQRIRAALGEDRTCVAALCDGTVGYIPTADAFAEGAYEPNASVLQPGEGERLADAVVALALAAPAH